VGLLSFHARSAFASASAVLATATLLLGVACGASGQFRQNPTPGATVNTEQLRQQVRKDANALRTAIEGTQVAQALNRCYELIERAGAETEPGKGSAMIQRGVPPLVAQAEQSLPSARHAVASVPVRTRTGRAIKQFDLSLLDEDVRLLTGLRSHLRKSKSAWLALIRFGHDSDTANQRLRAKFEAMLKSLPPAERAVLEQEIDELSKP
jgi:hypothetical protein